MQLYTSTFLLLAGSTAASSLWSSFAAFCKEAERHGFTFDCKSIENSVRLGADGLINSWADKGLDWVTDKANRDAVAARADAFDAEFTDRLRQAEAYKNAVKSQAEGLRKKYGANTVFKVKQNLKGQATVYINGIENDQFQSIARELLKGTNSGVQKQLKEKTFGFSGRISLDQALNRATRRAAAEAAALKQEGQVRVDTAKNLALAELEAAKKKCDAYFGVDCEERVQAARKVVHSFDKLGDIESALDYGKKLMAKAAGAVERI